MYKLGVSSYRQGLPHQVPSYRLHLLSRLHAKTLVGGSVGLNQASRALTNAALLVCAFADDGVR
jgi:hypothetical protein